MNAKEEIKFHREQISIWQQELKSTKNNDYASACKRLIAYHKNKIFK